MIRLNFDEQPFRARNAVLLYGQGSGVSHISYASVHDVSEDESGTLHIEAGVPASIAGLREMFTGLDPARIQRPTFFDPRIISSGPGWLVWWMRPCKRRVWFDAKGIGAKSERVPHPGLVFAVGPSGWQVFAVAGRTRPRPGTQLCQAPYFNVWDSGTICVGSAETPKGDDAGNPDKWERAFFESRFSHPNVHAPGRLVKYKGGPTRFWQHMLAGRFEQFPKEVLVPTDLTVARLLQAIGRAL